MRVRLCLKCGFRVLSKRAPKSCPGCVDISVSRPNQISAQPERAAKEVHPTTPEQGQSE